VNQARSRGRRDERIVPVSSLVTDDGPVVDADRFLDASHRWGGHWANPPRHPDTVPEDVLEGAETRAALREAVDALPPNQQRVLWLRDVQGFAADEVCTLLDISEANQRVLLHRARAKVRAALERRIEESGS
jgi:RNA polymerase sigma-70 factor (ECF subfamily)